MPPTPSPPKPDPQRTAKVLRALQDLQAASGNNNEYTILKLSEPISSAATNTNTTPAPRTSDISTTSLDTPTPTSLGADLAHYRELFAKLRFSYVEQVTKEKFIRAIVGDPPLIVTPQENADLEESNAAAKAELKALKVEVAGMVEKLEKRGRALVGVFEKVQRGVEEVGRLPGEIERLERRGEELRGLLEERQIGEGVGMPLGRTREVVEGKKRELEGLERQVEVLGGQVPRKRKEAERLKAEVAALENRRANCLAAAREAKGRRENALGGVGDELEARGRWYRASETVLRQVLDLQE